MRVRDWQEIMRDIVESDVKPDDWRAVAGPREHGIGQDLYLGHPTRGVYLLKSYPKNPFERRGVGTQIARSLDDELAPFLPTAAPARFGVQSGPKNEEEAKSRANRLEATVQTHADAPTSPDALFEDVMNALDSPAFGPLTFDRSERPDPIESLADTFDEANQTLNAELTELLDRDEIDRGFD